MAITLTGCYNVKTRKIIMDDDTCQWNPCMIFQGTHAGQVSLTPNTPACPDTYYGCVDFPSGTFNIVVPESCCHPCVVCEDGDTPVTITGEVSGASSCTCVLDTTDDPYFYSIVNDSGDPLIDRINGVSKTLTQTAGNACLYSAPMDADGLIVKTYNDLGPAICEDQFLIAEIPITNMTMLFGINTTSLLARITYATGVADSGGLVIGRWFGSPATPIAGRCVDPSLDPLPSSQDCTDQNMTENGVFNYTANLT